MEELKGHPFFKSIDWVALAAKQVMPTFKPVIESDESMANFDPKFTSVDLQETGIDIFDDDEDPYPSPEKWGVSHAKVNGNGTSSHSPWLLGM